MGGRSSSSNTRSVETNTIDLSRSAGSAGVSGDDNRVRITNTDFGAIRAALAAMRAGQDDAFDSVTEVSRGAIEASDRSNERVAAIADRSGDRNVEVVDKALEFGGGTVDQAFTFGGGALAAVLEDLAEARETDQRKLATTEQALSEQSQRVTDIAATRLTGGVTDVVKYLALAAAAVGAAAVIGGSS